jgi:hypothetical protein
MQMTVEMIYCRERTYLMLFQFPKTEARCFFSLAVCSMATPSNCFNGDSQLQFAGTVTSVQKMIPA